MVHRKFNKLKFRRTYIGGSKKSESIAFQNAQGTKDDNSDCDWLEYHRLLTHYMDDRLNIILSWRYVLHTISICLAVLVIFVLINNINIALVIVGVSMALYLSTRYLIHKEKQILSGYDFSLDITLTAIKKETGLNLSK